MTTLDEIRAKRSEILAIAERNGVENLRIFGSVARGDDRPDSDIDMFGTMRSGLWNFLGCQVELEELLNRKVDLVPTESIHKIIKNEIITEAVQI